MRLLLCVLLSCVSFSCFSQAGSLDKTFGDKGKVYTNVQDICYSVALQPDSKILAGGYVLIRYLPGGSLDSSFDKDAIIFQTNLSAIFGIEVLEDGKILIGGTSYSKVAAARFKTDGSPDSSFGENGTAIFHFEDGAGAH